MKRQHVDALFPLDGVDPHDGSLTRELDRSNERVELCRIEISFELLARIPFLDQNQGSAPVEIGEETRRAATWRDSRRFEDGSERTQQCGSHPVRRHDLQRKNDQGLLLSKGCFFQPHPNFGDHYFSGSQEPGQHTAVRRAVENVRIIIAIQDRPKRFDRGCCHAGSEMSELLRNLGVSRRRRMPFAPPTTRSV